MKARKTIKAKILELRKGKEELLRGTPPRYAINVGVKESESEAPSNAQTVVIPVMQTITER